MVTTSRVALAVAGILSVITLHECGHFVACKLSGVGTPEFAIGFGPTLFEKDIANTRFTLALIPLGGYVEILGMREAVPTLESKSFITKPYYKKLFILLGGIIANLLFFAIAWYFLRRRRPSDEVSADSESQDDIAEPTQEHALVGPVGIIRLASDSLTQGWDHYIWFLAVLSLNLALFNLIPLPVLDGGQVAICTFEQLAGFTLSEELYEMIMTITVILIAIVFISVTSNDITALFRSKK